MQGVVRLHKDKIILIVSYDLTNTGGFEFGQVFWYTNDVNTRKVRDNFFKMNLRDSIFQRFSSNRNSKSIFSERPLQLTSVLQLQYLPCLLSHCQ